MVEVQIDCIRMSLMTQSRVVILRQTDDERFLAIWIGPFEADAITFELQSVRPRRPLTHDLLKSVIAEMGAEIKHVAVTELRRPEDIFYAEIVLDLDGEEFHIDSRSSDAIALAVRAEVPIYVADDVMDAASVRPEEDVEAITGEPVAEVEDEEVDEERLDIFKNFVDTLDIDKLDDE
jgi:bifunctional DNase/RNase